MKTKPSYTPLLMPPTPLSQTAFSGPIEKYRASLQALVDIDISTVNIPQDILDIFNFAHTQGDDNYTPQKRSEKIVAFLYAPHPLLNNKTPIELLHSGSPNDIQMLKDALLGGMGGAYM